MIDLKGNGVNRSIIMNLFQIFFFIYILIEGKDHINKLYLGSMVLRQVGVVAFKPQV